MPAELAVQERLIELVVCEGEVRPVGTEGGVAKVLKLLDDDWAEVLPEPS